jgi:hypothetical protein
MKRILFLLTVSLMACNLIQAQTVTDSVKAAVNLLFEGMKSADASKVKSAFADSAILQTISNRQGK